MVDKESREGLSRGYMGWAGRQSPDVSASLRVLVLQLPPPVGGLHQKSTPAPPSCPHFSLEEDSSLE